uniref:Transmembrane protein 238 n=1 Tax=Chelonoidis abingdonii TaxID=106734 RepID=A0A8C0JEY7_CHEAB
MSSSLSSVRCRSCLSPPLPEFPLTMAAPGGLGRCVAAFWLALAFDALGLVVLLTGVFANLFFSDLLIYAGGIGIFLSLIWWVFWYAGNLEVPPAELCDDVGLGPPKDRGDSLLRGLVRGLSTRISAVFSSAPRSSPPAPAGQRPRVGAGARVPARGAPRFLHRTVLTPGAAVARGWICLDFRAGRGAPA